MKPLQLLFQSSIGKKVIVGATGAVLLFYVLGHLAGNLQIFMAKEHINGYAHLLHSNEALLWAVRLGLIGAVGLHVWAAISLSQQNRSARPEAYRQGTKAYATTWAARHMLMTGLVIAAFVIYHILHLTLQVPAFNLLSGSDNAKDFSQLLVADGPQKGFPDVHRMVVAGFQQPVIALFYLIAVGLLAFHLSHGTSSMFQSLGLQEGVWRRRLDTFAKGFAIVIFAGYASIPVAVSSGSSPPIKRLSALMKLESNSPPGPLSEKWTQHLNSMRLVAPNNKRRYEVIVVGTGLAGASAAASLSELGYRVKALCFHDSPRRAHSIAAQGGINAAKNYPNDGDSVHRLYYDTIKGGDFRARESNVHRLAEISVRIIDQCVAQGVPFAREYGGLLANRSFGGAQVSRTFYARGQTGQQLLLGAYSALCKQIADGGVEMLANTEMLDLVVIDGVAKGIITRNVNSGEVLRHAADAIVLATGGYGNVFNLSTYARGSNATAIWRAYRRGAGFANPSFTQIHPTCIPVSGDYQSKLTLMSESLRNDGRCWVPRKPGDKRPVQQIAEEERDYYLERMYPAYGNLAPRDIASRAAKRVCDEGRGVGESGLGVYLDFSDAIRRLGLRLIKERYGNLFDIYHEITGEDAYQAPMRIFPAVHYTMGGLWVDYDLMSNIPGLFVLGEANFSDHGANRLGASALMQGLADGYFVIPYTLGHYLATLKPGSTPKTDAPEFAATEKETQDRVRRLLGIKGKRNVSDFHKHLGRVLWENCGMARNRAGLEEALRMIPEIRAEFWSQVNVTGDSMSLNQALERAHRVADFLELGELLCRDALAREESCGCHFREEYQEAGECKRNDGQFAHVAVWEFKGDQQPAVRHVEPLAYEFTKLATRSYK